MQPRPRPVIQRGQASSRGCGVPRARWRRRAVTRDIQARAMLISEAVSRAWIRPAIQAQGPGRPLALAVAGALSGASHRGQLRRRSPVEHAGIGPPWNLLAIHSELGQRASDNSAFRRPSCQGVVPAP